MFTNATIDSMLRVPYSEADMPSITKDLIIRSRFDASNQVQLYSVEDGEVSLPRHYLGLTSRVATRVEDKRSVGSSIKVSPTTELYDYQKGVLSRVKNYLTRGATGIFLEAPPGTGKTVMGIHCVIALQRTALVIVPKSDLVDQWMERFIQHTNLRERDFAIVDNGRVTKNWRQAKIIIGLVHTLATDRFGPEFNNWPGVVLYDEVDRSLPPQTFAPSASLFPAKWRIGMTASATRTDGMHPVFWYHLKQFHIKIDSGKVMTPKAYLVRYTGRNGFVPPGIELIKRRGILISMISEDLSRNVTIADIVKTKCYDNNKPVLVISDRKEQLKTIYGLLVDRYKIPKSDIGYYVRSLDGKTLKDSYRDEVAANASIILGTYGMIRMGTDIQRLEDLVLASPQSDMRQTEGRIGRFLEGKQQPVIYDFVDTSYEDCKKWAVSRVKHYTSRGIEVKELVLR